jgi:hypothetical protein
VTEFPFDGRWYRQEQDFFCSASRTGGSTSRLHDVERRTVDAHRWWGLAELATAPERVYPPDLAELLARVLGAGAEAAC